MWNALRLKNLVCNIKDQLLDRSYLKVSQEIINPVKEICSRAEQKLVLPLTNQLSFEN